MTWTTHRSTIALIHRFPAGSMSIQSESPSVFVSLDCIPCTSVEQAQDVAEWLAPRLAALHAEAVARQQALAEAEQAVERR